MTVLETSLAPTAKLERPHLGHIPGPRTIPFICKTISFSIGPYGTYFNQVARFGDVFRMTVFGETWGVLAGPDELEHVYLNRENIFSAQSGLRTFAPFFSVDFFTVTASIAGPIAVGFRLLFERQH